MAPFRDVEVGTVGKAEQVRPDLQPDGGRPHVPSLDSAIQRGTLDPRARKWVRPRLRHGASHCAQELLKPASISRRNRLETLAISSPLGSN